MAYVSSFRGSPWLTIDQLAAKLDWDCRKTRHFVNAFRAMLNSYALVRRGSRGKSGRLLLHPMVVRAFRAVRAESERAHCSLRVILIQMYGGRLFDFLGEECSGKDRTIALLEERVAYLEECIHQSANAQPTGQPAKRLLRRRVS